MPVKKGKNGERSVEAEVEVPGSPEEVWRAIASGEGISSWFMPSTVEECEGGKVVCSFGPGMDSVATITAWNPPQNFVAETEEGPGKVATEWIVEARGGGKCVVRVVHRWFASTDDWDGEFEGHQYGWSSFFRILRLYLEHFAGQRCVIVPLSAFSKASAPETWRAMKSALTIDEKAQRFASAPGAPVLSGAIETIVIDDPELLSVRERSPQIVAALEGMGDENPELFLRLDRPAPGIAHLFVMAMGETTMVSIRFFLYGEEGAAGAEGVQREWGEWLARRFPEGAS